MADKDADEEWEEDALYEITVIVRKLVHHIHSRDGGRDIAQRH